MTGLAPPAHPPNRPLGDAASAQPMRRSRGLAHPLRSPRKPSSDAGRAETVQSEPRWISLEPEAIARELRTDLRSGLDPAEAQARLERDGENALGEKPPRSSLSLFFGQFADVTVMALIVAAVIAVALGWNERRADTFLHRFGDAIAIAIIVALNAAVGFVQERKADRALRALKQLGAPTANVIRGGRVERIATREIVAGDLVELREGDRVPADARLIETSDLVTNESALTGESQPVDKLEAGVLDPDTPLAERANMTFMGTHVVRGRGIAVVVGTGLKTELGRIAALLGEVKTPETPLQLALRRFGLWVVAGCAILGVLVFIVGLVRLEVSVPFLLLTAVSLAVAAIPEGLPAVTTIVLALGVQRMVRKNALIRRLAAVETLGAADVICTDKTGTLTQNRMLMRRACVAGRVFDLDGGGAGLRPSFDPLDAVGELVIACGTAPAARLPDDGGSPLGDPTDAALMRIFAAHREGIAAAGAEVETIRVIPFDRERRMATAIVSGRYGVRSYTHGAPEAVLACTAYELAPDASELPVGAERKRELSRTVDEWARAGLRVIAIARAPSEVLGLEQASLSDRESLRARVENELVLCALVGLADPPRSEAKLALERAQGAGVRTVMITGDHPLTARAIATELGILPGGDVITGPEIDQLDEAELSERMERVRVVARASAQNKLRLVDALRDHGHVVAMTGDGVNDAPAIKAASIGVAMGRGGTDVSREAADMVLLDDNYATIVSAIEQGRIVYGNIKRFIVFLFAVNTGLVLAVLTAALLGWPPLLTPTEILWVNLITNGLPALALGMEAVHLDPMSRPPRSRTEGLVTPVELRHLLLHGAYMGVLGVATFAWFLPQDAALARTATFTLLAIAPLFHALSARSRTRSLFSLGVATNPRLLGAFVFALVLQGLAIYVPTLSDVFATKPLEPRVLAAVLGLSASVLLVGELEKWLRARRSAPQ